MLKKTLKRNKGITLIALVVTIIVLLILAGISINMLMGQNGILNRAQEAKSKTEKGSVREELELAITSLGMDYHINGQGGTFRDYIFSHEAELKKELGSDDVTLNKTENTITYKGKIFTVNEDGSIEAVDGIALTDTKKTLQIVDGTAEEATITGVAKGTVEIVAKTKNLEAKCTLTVKESSVFGQYVEYDVSYTDAYDSSKEYTTTNGWRILKQTKVSDGVYNVDIISTGIPAKLYYYYSDVSSAPWAGKNTQLTDYVTKYYAYNNSAENNNVIAAAGLLNNFTSIKFKGNSYSDHNLGFYTKITKGSTTYTGEEINGSVFVAREGAKVRSVMHTDIPGLTGGTNGSIVSSWGDLSSDVFTLQKLGYTNGKNNNIRWKYIMENKII